MFTTGWAAPRRRSACRTADVLALKSHNLDATTLVRAPNFGDPVQRHRQFCASSSATASNSRPATVQTAPIAARRHPVNDPAAIERVRPLLDAIGQRTWVVGIEPHQANVAKLAVNFLLASAIEAMAEATTLAERYEIDPAKLMEVITETSFAAPATYSQLIIQGEFKPGFKLTLGLKDIRLALAAGEAIGVPLPFASVVRDNLVDAIGHGDAGKDWSALALVARRRAELGR